jgi:hypothetical protein
MKSKLWCAVLVLACCAANAVAQINSGAQTSAASQIKVPESWDKLAAKADEVVNVTLDKKTLAFAARFMNDKDDKDARQLIENLNGVYVRSLEFRDSGAFTDADVEPIRAQLRGPEWSRIVDVSSRADKEKVEIYVRMVNDRSAGMVILAQEPTELTFVHLDGPINPDQLGELSGNFGIPKDIRVHAQKPAPKSPTASTSKPPAPRNEVKP